MAESDDGLSWKAAKEDTILSIHDEDVGLWENRVVYQPFLLEHGDKYWNFYNARRANGAESIGIAFSDDLFEWKRYENNPVLTKGPDGSWNEHNVASGKVWWDTDHWVMFFFGVRDSEESNRVHAHIMVAFSRDLYHWTVDPDPLYKAGEHPDRLDWKHAHKISIVWNPASQSFYMFYCAYGNKGRGIGLVTSKPLTK